MSSTTWEPRRKRRMPTAMWLTLLVSIGLHILLLMDFHFAHRQGNGEQLHAVRVRLEPATLPVSRSAQAKQQQGKPTRNIPDTPQTRASVRETGSEPEVRHRQAQSQPASQLAADRGEQQDIRLRYIESLLRQIESRKYYPSTARRRGIEGRIQVKFTLYEADDIRDVSISGDSDLLKRVSREALEAALPFTPAPEGVALPLSVQYIMDYSLH